MKRLLSLGSLLVAVMATLISVASAEPVSLRYQFKPGSRTFVRMTTEVEQQQNLNGTEIKTSMKQTMLLDREFQQPNDKGQTQLRDKTSRLQMSMTAGPLAEYKYDSASPDNDRQSLLGKAAAPALDALSGAVVDIVVTERGEIISVKGLKEVLEGALAGNPQAATFAGAAATEDGAKQSYSEHFALLPEKPVNPGDSWERPITLPLGALGKAEGKIKFTYGGLDTSGGRSLHRIDTSTDLKVDIDSKMQEYKVVGKLEATGSKGRILFDAEAGQLVSRTTEVTMKGDLVIDVNGMAIPLRMEQIQKATVESFKEAPKD